MGNLFDAVFSQRLFLLHFHPSFIISLCVICCSGASHRTNSETLRNVQKPCKTVSGPDLVDFRLFSHYHVLVLCSPAVKEKKLLCN